MYDHYFSNFGRSPVSDDICIATLVDLLFPMIYVKVQPSGILGFGEEDF